MNAELKKSYQNLLTNQVIFSGDEFKVEMIAALLKTALVVKWNSLMNSADQMINAAEVEILDYTYWSAEPDRIVVSVDWKII